MSKVDYDIEFGELANDNFFDLRDCIQQVAFEHGHTEAEVIDNEDMFYELYKLDVCELYHFKSQKLGKTLRGLQDIDVYEVTKEGQVIFFKSYPSRFSMSFDLEKVYKLNSAFAFCPSKALGYVIHGDVTKCKDYLSTMTFLYSEINRQKETEV